MNTTKAVTAIMALSLGLGNVAFAQSGPHPGPGDMDPRRLEHPDGRIRGQAREAPRAPHRDDANNRHDRREQARQEQARQLHARQEQARHEQARHEQARHEQARHEQARHEQARHEQLRRQQSSEQARIERERQAQLVRQHQRDEWRGSRDHGYDRSDFQERRFQEGHYDGRQGDRRHDNRRYDDIRYQERWSHDDRRWNQHWDRGAGPQHNLRRGDRLPVYYRNYNYVVHDWQGHHLRPPPVGYQWVQAGGDYVLVAIATGVILSLLLSN